jgi:hypothetical protein
MRKERSLLDLDGQCDECATKAQTPGCFASLIYKREKFSIHVFE